MSRNISIELGEYYHIYNRGTDKREIFLEPNDYRRFLYLLYLCNDSQPAEVKKYKYNLSDTFQRDRISTIADVCLYCLMPNHFHILVREKTEGGIARFMQKVTTGYTMYFNLKRSRSGALFEGRYKARHADSDNYLKYLFSYVHLNPVKLVDSEWKQKGIKDLRKAEAFTKRYPYSSYVDFLDPNKRQESAILSPNTLPEYFSSTQDFEETVKDWLTFSQDHTSSSSSSRFGGSTS